MAKEPVLKYQQPDKKAGLIARLRSRTKRSSTGFGDKRDQTPSPPTGKSSPVNEFESETRIVTPSSTSSKPVSVKGRKRSKLPFREEVTLDRAPTAREAAFAGPPRYDWIDIETCAAIKVQSVYRRNKALRELEEQGLSTAVTRNRLRRRKALKGGGVRGTDDIPSLFRCCGVGLAFGDATEEDYEYYREQDKQSYMERKKEKEAREAELRNSYRRHNFTQKPQGNTTEEAFEVLDE